MSHNEHRLNMDKFNLYRTRSESGKLGKYNDV